MSNERHLTLEKIREIRYLRAKGYSYGQIRDIARVSKATAYMYGSGVPVKKLVSFSDLLDQAINICVWTKIAPQIIERIQRDPLRDPEEIFDEYHQEEFIRNLAGLHSPEEATEEAKKIKEKIKKQIEQSEEIRKQIERLEEQKELEKQLEKRLRPLREEIEELKRKIA